MLIDSFNDFISVKELPSGIFDRKYCTLLFVRLLKFIVVLPSTTRSCQKHDNTIR